VDIKADFSLLYDAVDKIASEWNGKMNEIQNSVTTVIQDKVDSV
jgi:hypothetical protein